MFSEVKRIPRDFKLIVPINSDVNLYQKQTEFIGEIALPTIFGQKKYYLKLEGITPEYVEKHLVPPMGFTFEEFDTLNDHLILLCLSIINILKNREKYKSAIYLMRPAEICCAFLAAAITGFIKEKDFKDQVLYVIAQTLQIVYGIAQENAKN